MSLTVSTPEVETRTERGYRPIEDYAILGDGHSAALVARDGSIDWCCWPRFDSDAVFCRLLDRFKGGYMSVTPTRTATVQRSYVDGTNVLQSSFETGEGVVRLTDCMCVEAFGEQARRDVRRTLLRMLEGRRGNLEVEIAFKPTFGFASREPTFHVQGTTVVAQSGSEVLQLQAPWRFHVTDAGVAFARGTVRVGEKLWCALIYGCQRYQRDSPISNEECSATLERAIKYWQAWSARCAYDGPYASLVRRSALALKLLIFAPTGAIIAAPTTSLPEQIGGIRNWDYRFTWLRDTSLALDALMSLGYHDEAMAFWEWLQRLRLVEGGPLQNVYRIDGAAEIPEMTLSHLEGYAQSRPVRVGNGAAAQRQLDVHGEVLAAAYTCVTGMKTTPHARFGGVLRYLAERAASDWKLPDQGIWEMRTPPRHFVHSKLLCWVALDRALRLAELGVLEGPLSAWRRAREQICTAILERGLDQKSGAFTQSFDDSALDASALVIPFVGFLEPHDPRVRATVEKIRERLTSNGLVYRYVDTDGLPRGEAAFGLCTLWLAEALALEGRLDDAHEAFARVTRFANDVGLLSEQLDASTGGLRGNFPQAFTHLALIRAARGLADAAKPQPRAIRSFGLVKEK